MWWCAKWKAIAWWCGLFDFSCEAADGVGGRTADNIRGFARHASNRAHLLAACRRHRAADRRIAFAGARADGNWWTGLFWRRAAGFISHESMGRAGIFLAAIVASPLLASLAMRIWAHSPVGRRIILQPSVTMRQPSAISLGQIGVTVTPLRPMGECDFDDQRMEAVSQIGIIPAGTKVKIIAIDNGRPTVRVES